MSWTVSTSKDGIVGRYRDWESARRACLNDYGRTLVIHDTIGRLAAMYRDGKEVA